MRAVRMHGFGGPDVLRLDTVPIPLPAHGQVRVRVHAVGINPFEWKLREGRLRGRFDVALPFVPGFDVAGVIDEVGTGAGDWKAGDAVVAALHRAPQGGYAEYAVARIEDMVSKPASWSFEEACGIPTPAVTAWRFMVGIAGLKSGQRVFIQGAAGGVGSAAVQIAKALGAHVVATASAANLDYLRSLGADEVLDYRAERFENHLRDIDIVLDNVGGDLLGRALGAMRPGAILVSPTGPVPAEACARAQVMCPPPPPPGAAFGPPLLAIRALAEAGRFRVHVDSVFALEDAATAQEINRQGHTRGKIVLRVSGDRSG